MEQALPEATTKRLAQRLTQEAFWAWTSPERVPEFIVDATRYLGRRPQALSECVEYAVWAALQKARE